MSTSTLHRPNSAALDAFHLRARARIEDLEWMATTGENFFGAAKRLGITPEALRRFCERQNRYDLVQVLNAKNPRRRHL